MPAPPAKAAQPIDFSPPYPRFPALSLIALTNARNGGEGRPGLDFISGWNWVEKKKGWPGISAISIRFRFFPEKIIPFSSILGMYSGFTS